MGRPLTTEKQCACGCGITLHRNPGETAQNWCKRKFFNRQHAAAAREEINRNLPAEQRRKHNSGFFSGKPAISEEVTPVVVDLNNIPAHVQQAMAARMMRGALI